MKNVLVLIFCFSSLLSFSQLEPEYGSIFNTYVYAEVEFRNGEEKSGLGKLNYDNELLYKELEGSKKHKYSYREVKSIIFHTTDGKKKYIYKIIKEKNGKNRVLPLVESIEDGLSLYYYINEYSASSSANVTGNMQVATGATIEVKIYCLGKEGEDTVTKFGTGNTKSKRFKKIAKKYFSDCPELIEQIKNDYFEKSEIEEVVKYYNNNCN